MSSGDSHIPVSPPLRLVVAPLPFIVYDSEPIFKDKMQSGEAPAGFMKGSAEREIFSGARGIDRRRKNDD
jgi:hypothetical protein